MGRVFLGVGVLKQPGHETGADRRTGRFDLSSASRDVAMQVGEPEPVDLIPTAERPGYHVFYGCRKRIGIRASHVDRSTAHIARGAMRSGDLPFDLRYPATTPPAHG